ncbi:hypothetical protein NDU88_005052 [Pleurodeles waltl]|uniref:Uncharacterized protein n=1 Tax=Pleurodeles waltl TaxID=8319 RepID=A0AAV7NLD4_PLEWA|nr:hypothetical protein NDU88_005052 [Pleurodeles waltl]
MVTRPSTLLPTSVKGKFRLFLLRLAHLFRNRVQQAGAPTTDLNGTAKDKEGDQPRDVNNSHQCSRTDSTTKGIGGAPGPVTATPQVSVISREFPSARSATNLAPQVRNQHAGYSSSTKARPATLSATNSPRTDPTADVPPSQRSQSTTCTHRSSRTNPPPHAARFCPEEIQAPGRITISRGSGTHLHTLLPGPTSTEEERTHHLGSTQPPRGTTATANRPTQTPLQPQGLRPQAPERSVGPAPIEATLCTRPRSDMPTDPASGDEQVLNSHCPQPLRSWGSHPGGLPGEPARPLDSEIREATNTSHKRPQRGA